MVKRSKSTGIRFEEKRSRDGKVYLQGCDEHSNMLLFKDEWETQKRGAPVWTLDIKSSRRFP